jgi:putative nucleotidyltransferase with HDIG domain
VQELAVNAKRANTKRVFFYEHGLDINDPADYKLGMENFKKETSNNSAHYLQTQKEKGLYIKITLQLKRNTIYIDVRNNVIATRAEQMKIHDRLARSRQFGSMEEAMSQLLNDSEGSGLGLVILAIMLKKIGLNEECLDIKTTDKETIAGISIPLDKTVEENLSALSRAIVDNVNSLPQFPENILHIQKIIADPKSGMPIIARQISTDPALTADLLRIVNSAQYMLVKKVDNISEAVKVIGINGVKNLLFSYGTQKVLGDDTVDKKRLWNHSYKTAFYAHTLYKSFKKNRELLDDVYAGGILHDMGKIIFYDVHPDLLDKIKDFTFERNIQSSIFENLSTGMNHAEIGAMITEKWNFPERLVMIIRYHHDPCSVSPEHRDMVDAVYLANMLCEYDDGYVSFEQFETSPLENYGIKSKNQADALLDRLSSGFMKESQQ